MEVLQGIRDEQTYIKVKNFLESLNIINATYQDYILSANIYRQCRKNGKTIRKSIDCLITSISINNNLKLFSNDRDFNSIYECFEFQTFKTTNPNSNKSHLPFMISNFDIINLKSLKGEI